MFTTITLYWYSGVKNGFISDKVGCMVNLFVLDSYQNKHETYFSLLYFKKWIVNNFLNTIQKNTNLFCVLFGEI